VTDTILLVEDDQKLANVVREFLVSKGFALVHESDGHRAVRRIIDENPDLIILDLLLPGLSGLDVCRQIRPRYAGPILMLTALQDEVDEVVGLEVGADDYLAKPVRPRLLLARISALLRRARERTPGSRDTARGDFAPIVIGGMTIDPSTREACLDGQRLDLTAMEFELLHYLAARAGQVVSREQICRGLRGSEWDGLDRSIDIRVTRLRRKLGDRGKNPEVIKSVRGEGYMMVARR
jgi:two-component system response regulator RstA